MTLSAAAPLAFATAPSDPEPEELTEEPGGAREASDRRNRLDGVLQRDMHHLAFVALLADPTARATLAPRLSPADLPAQVPEGENLGNKTTDEWRDALFDEAGRLVVPSPDDPNWNLFVAWANHVNPDLWVEADRLRNT